MQIEHDQVEPDGEHIEQAKDQLRIVLFVRDHDHLAKPSKTESEIKRMSGRPFHLVDGVLSLVVHVASGRLVGHVLNLPVVLIEEIVLDLFPEELPAQSQVQGDRLAGRSVVGQQLAEVGPDVVHIDLTAKRGERVLDRTDRSV